MAREAPQILGFSPPGRFPGDGRISGDLRLVSEPRIGDATPPTSPSRQRVMWTKPQSPTPSPKTSINPRWNASVPVARQTLGNPGSPRGSTRAAAPARPLSVVRQSSNGTATASALLPVARQGAQIRAGSNGPPAVRAQAGIRFSPGQSPVDMARPPPRVVPVQSMPSVPTSPQDGIQRGSRAYQAPPSAGASLTYQAANSEDMEGRSISGCSEVARAAFDRDLKLVQARIQAVSLGGSCGPKISLRRLGLGEATMPFDWMRTRVRGLISWLRHGFDDFLHVNQRLEVTFQDTALTVYRSPTHSFWHDDIQDEDCREKLRRRMERFLALANADKRPLLFVRGIAGSQELEHTEELFLALRERFEVNGRKVYLLLMLEDQPILGPVMHSKYDELILWVQPRFEGRVSTDVSIPAPYEDAIAFSVRHILGDRGGLYPGEPPEQWPMVDQALDILSPGSTFWNAGCRETEVGLWVGNVRTKGSSRDALMSAFQGVDKLEGQPVRLPRVSQGAAYMESGASLPLQPQVTLSSSGIPVGSSVRGASPAAGPRVVPLGVTVGASAVRWARDMSPALRRPGSPTASSGNIFMPLVAY